MLGAIKRGGAVEVLPDYNAEIFKDMVIEQGRAGTALPPHSHYLPLSKTNKALDYITTRAPIVVVTTSLQTGDTSGAIVPSQTPLVFGSPQSHRLSPANTTVYRARLARFDPNYIRDWSLEFWIRTDGVETGNLFCNQSQAPAHLDQISHWVNFISLQANKIRYHRSSIISGATDVFDQVGQALTAGVRHHIVINFNGTTNNFKLYINDILDTDLTLTNTLSGEIAFTSTAPPNGWRHAYIFLNTINGYLSNVALYPTRLTDNQIKTHYSVGKLTVAQDPDYDKVVLLLGGQGYDGSTTIVDQSKKVKKIFPKNGAAITTAQGKFPGTSSIAFNGNNNNVTFGTSQHLTFPNYSDLNLRDLDFTVETWLRFNTAPFQHGGATILSLPRWTSGTPALTFVVQIDSGSTRLKAYINTGAGDLQPEVPFSPIANTWYHLALCRTGSMLNFFINGVKIGTGTNIGSGAIPPISSYSSVGAWILSTDISIGSTTQNLDGQLQDLRVTKGLARYTADFTPPTEPFPNN